jgi:hypothetical protein
MTVDEWEETTRSLLTTDDGGICLDLTRLVDLVMDKSRAAIVQAVVEALQQETPPDVALATRLAGLRLIRDPETRKITAQLPS